MGRRAACCDESAATAGGGKRTEETGVWKEDATHPSKEELKKGMYFSADVSEFLFVLSKHRVQYLIVGGEAVIYYGHARLTGDIDIWYNVAQPNAHRLFGALKEFWDRDIPGINDWKELTKKGMIFQFGVPPNRIDLISDIEGIGFSEAWKGRTTERLSFRRNQFHIFYIGLEDLLKNKRVAGRPRDMEDLKFLTKALRRRKGRS